MLSFTLLLLKIDPSFILHKLPQKVDFTEKKWDERLRVMSCVIFITFGGAYDASAISFRIRSSFLLSCREI